MQQRAPHAQRDNVRLLAVAACKRLAVLNRQLYSSPPETNAHHSRAFLGSPPSSTLDPHTPFGRTADSPSSPSSSLLQPLSVSHSIGWS